MGGWRQLYVRAVQLDRKADAVLNDALRKLLAEKGLPADGFFVCFASGNETVVHYHDDEGCKGGLSDLDMRLMAVMTASEIRRYFGI